VTWSASVDSGGSGLSQYRIHRNGALLTAVGATVTTYTDPTAQPSTTYSYRVSAVDNAQNESMQSAAATATTPADTSAPSPPTGLVAVPAGTTRIDLTWNAATDSGGSGLAGYRVFRNGTQIATGISSTAYSDTTVAPGATHSYTVRALDNAGNVSTESNVATVTTGSDGTPPSAPSGLTATASGSTRVDLSWSAATDSGGSGLAGYRVLRNGVQIASGITSTVYADNAVAPSTSYSYTVRAIDGAGNVSADSNTAQATTGADTVAPSAPTGLAASALSSTSIRLTWNASSDSGGSGLAGYRVFRGGTQIATGVAGTTYTDGTLTPNTSYSYTVRALDGAGNVSGASNAASTTTSGDTTAPPAPAALSATASGSTQINLAWNAVTDTGGSGLAGYRVLRGGVQIANNVVGTTYSDSGLTASTTYQYTVRAFDNAGNVSGSSNTASATTAADTTAPSVPTGVTATSTGSTTIQIAWSASTDTGGSGLGQYRIYRNGTLLTAVLAAQTSFNDAGLTPNTTYTYRVTARDNALNESAQSAAANATTAADTIAPSAPTALAASAASATSVQLTWTASVDTGGSGLAGYRVFRDGTQIATGITAISYTDNTVVGSNTYSYVVRAIDNAGNVSGPSNAAQVTTPAAQIGGLDTRPSNTTCLAPAQPSTNTSVSVDRVFSGASFTSPILMVQAPGESNRWYAVQQRGVIERFDVSNPAGTRTTWADLQGIVNDNASEAGLLGLAFHPGYATNGRVFVSYTGAGANPFQSHISEFRRGANGLLDPTTERIFLRVDQPFDNHNGGNIVFGPDGNLYVGFGDGGSGGDPGNRSQNRNLLLGKILRVNVDGATPYTIPSDNPYAGNSLCSLGTGSSPCPEIYAYGFRNPWRWSFDRASSEPELWVADVGQNAWEEVDRVERGGNYGWRIREGAHCFNPSSNCPTAANGAPLIDPVAEYDHNVGLSITGGYVYRGSAIPSLRGRYVFGDFVSSRLFYLAPNASGGFDRRDLGNPGLGISSFAEDNQGELYITDYGGGLYKLNPGTGTIVDTIPADLADTGCVNPSDPTQPASGLIPYAPTAQFWSDGADKIRWMALPNGQTITIASDGDWSFPNGTVLVKNFRLGGRLIETRLFMRHPNGNWGGYTYRWNSGQTAATLVKGGAVAHISPPGQDWIYPSEAQCLQCHTAVAGRSLGLETAQLNSELTYPTTGRTANQLLTLNLIGMFSTPLPQPPNQLPAYPNPYGTSGTVTARARAYLHTNCAQCHRPGGPTPSSMDLRYNTAIGSSGTCNVTPTSGDLGIANARLIVPGDASRSLIFVRMSRRDTHQMPPLGSNLVDTAGAALIQSWVNTLNANCQ
jgi:uncharacterized repeat protein (TIGR03806 family)